AVLLGRPPRETVLMANPTFVGDGFGDEYTDRYVDNAIRRHSVNSQFRLASRDSRVALNNPALRYADPQQAAEDVWWDDIYTFDDPARGPAAWRGMTGNLGTLVNNLLQQESGITIPKASFVARSLLFYLALLVPANYLFFRLIGRLEYAWLAVPVIAIGGAIYVARAAQLDIGFARSHTQMALLEIQGDHSRGHLTRYCSLYTSLGSNYEIEFATPQAIAAPIHNLEESMADTRMRLGDADGPILDRVAIASNKTRKLQSEEVYDVGGAFRLMRDDANNEKLSNGTTLELLDAYVLRRRIDGVLEVADVGLLDPEETVSLRFQERESAMVNDDLPMRVNDIMLQFARRETIPAGETRLVARMDTVPDGMVVRPAAPQVSGQTAVLVHLKHAPRPKVQPDKNLRKVIKGKRS
ncbi:MAG: hypothetical protein AAFN70_00260, partial [Planctomycetota bacterium]